MSYESAISACRACFGLNGLSSIKFLDAEKRRTARYEALMAIDGNDTTAMNARISCRGCDYSAPRIAELLEKR